MEHRSIYPTLDPAAGLTTPQLPYFIEESSQLRESRLFHAPGAPHADHNSADEAEGDEGMDGDGEDDSEGHNKYALPQGVPSHFVQEAEALTKNVTRSTGKHDENELQTLRQGSQESESNISPWLIDNAALSPRVPTQSPDAGTHQEIAEKLVEQGERGRGYGIRGRPRGRRRGFGLGRGSQGGVIKPRGGARGRPRGSKTRSDARTGPVRPRVRGVGQTVPGNKEYRDSQSEATACFLEKDYEAALEHAKHAVLTNPEIFAGHNLLSEIYRGMGKAFESLSVLWVGAHVSRQAGLWWDVLNRTKELSVGTKVQQFENLAYCLTKILSFNKKDYDAHRQRLELYQQLPTKQKALTGCRSILAVWPTDVEILQIRASIVVEGHIKQDLNGAKNAYQTAINVLQNEPTSDSQDLFSFSDLNSYMDLFMESKKWGQGLEVLKRVARWLCGRRRQVYWDAVTDDDREWDGEDEPRRTQIATFSPGEFPPAAYAESLPVELRIKMGLFRLHLGNEHFEEAMQHFEYLEPTDKSPNAPVKEYPELFADVGTCLFKLQRFGSSLRFFEPLERSGYPVDHIVLERMARAYKEIDRLKAAIRCYERIDQEKPNQGHVLAEIGRLYNARGDIEQATIYTDRGMLQFEKDRRKHAERLAAYKKHVISEGERPDVRHLPEEVSTEMDRLAKGLDEGGLRESTNPEYEPLASRLNIHPAYHGRSKASAAARDIMPVLQKQKKVFPVPLISTRMQLLRSKMLEEDKEAQTEWLAHAQDMMAAFQDKPKFLWFGRPEARYVEKIQTPHRLNLAQQNSTVRNNTAEGDDDVFFDANQPHAPIILGVSLAEWLDICLEYALITAKASRQAQSYEALRVASASRLFSKTDAYLYHIHLTWVICALFLGDEDTLCKAARWFVTALQFRTDAYRLFATVNLLLKNHEPRAYSNTASQMFFRHQIKDLDAVLRGASDCATTSMDGNSSAHNGANLQLLLLHGHIFILGDAPVAALHYYFRAYSVRPDSALLCLSISIAYAQVAQRNRCEERNATAMRAIAFFEEYKRLRLEVGEDGGGNVKQPKRFQEVQYNEGRMYHAFAMLREATAAYERCLDAGETSLAGEANGGGPVDDLTGTAEDAGLRHRHAEDDYTREAALALQLIHLTTNDLDMARKVTEEWLIF